MNRIEIAFTSIRQAHPLFEHLSNSSDLALKFRPYDARWAYCGIVKSFQAGFNPFCGQLYAHQNSLLSRWIGNPALPKRDIARKILMKETLFLAHDYLHHWAFQQIASFLGANHIDNYYTHENLVFFLLVSEAVATVGLDYWILSNLNLCPFFDLSESSFQLTIQLSQSQIQEIRKINPDFSINRESLFGEICGFYLDGEMKGFDIKDLESSTHLQNYLIHELRYGAMQRRYARHWATFLMGANLSICDEDAPIQTSETWKADLIGFIGSALWNGVWMDTGISPDKVPMGPFQTPVRGSIDTRLVCIEKFIDPSLSEFLTQYPESQDLVLSRIDYSSYNDTEIGILIREFADQDKPFRMDSMLSLLRKAPSSLKWIKGVDAVGDFDDHLFCLP